MAQGKVEVKLGPLSFAGEGDEKWLSEELNKVLEKAPAILQGAGNGTVDNSGALSGLSDGASGNLKHKSMTLAGFLKLSKAGSNQTRIFLATSEWLHSQGKKLLTTGEVAKALADNQQKKLSNPAQCLNSNVSKGHCEKQGGKQFYVTPEGRTSLGMQAE